MAEQNSSMPSLMECDRSVRLVDQFQCCGSVPIENAKEAVVKGHDIRRIVRAVGCGTEDKLFCGNGISMLVFLRACLYVFVHVYVRVSVNVYSCNATVSNRLMRCFDATFKLRLNSPLTCRSVYQISKRPHATQLAVDYIFSSVFVCNGEEFIVITGNQPVLYFAK